MKTTSVVSTPTALTAQESQYLSVLEATIKNGLGVFWKVGEALAEIRDRRLYRAEYPTFEEYCNKKWDFSSRRAYQLIESAEVNRDVKKALPSGKTDVNNCSHSDKASKSVTNVTLLNEGQARALVSTPRARRGPILKAAIKTAPNGKLTASHIKSVAQTAKDTRAKSAGAIVKAHLARPVPKPSAPNDALQRCERQIAEAVNTIKAQKLWRKAAESFDDYWDGLSERIKGEE